MSADPGENEAKSSPIRQKSAHGHPRPTTTIERTCRTCGASFLGLDLARTGERGLWGGPNGWSWFCSIECAPPEETT